MRGCNKCKKIWDDKYKYADDIEIDASTRINITKYDNEPTLVVEVEDYDCNIAFIPIDYCPWCGKKLY